MKTNVISLLLLGLVFSFYCAIFCLAADPPATTKDNYNITMNDGTVLVGTIQIKQMGFNGSYGATDVSLGDVMSFSGGFLTLNDGSKLKGTFSSGSLTLETARGEMNLPFASITSIAKESAVASAVAATPAPASPTISSSGNGANLTGKVYDCFGKPLAGVSVSVQNTRFSATTDAQGNYSLGYVPGAIQVSYSKDGYYATSLTFQIATPSLYPVQDLILFKELPAKGIFFIGENDYVKSVNSIQLKNLESKQFSWAAANTENQHFIAGAPLLIKPAKDFRFVFNNKNSDSPVTTVLFRVQPGSPFVRRVQYGVGNIKFLGDQIKSGTVLQVGNFELWTGHLDAGFYVFVTQYNPELDNFTSFGEPCLYFRVGDEANAVDNAATEKPPENPTLMTTNANSSAVRQNANDGNSPTALRDKLWNDFKQKYPDSPYSSTATFKYRKSLAEAHEQTIQGIKHIFSVWKLQEETKPNDQSVCLVLAPAGLLAKATYPRTAILMLSQLDGGLVEMRVAFWIYPPNNPNPGIARQSLKVDSENLFVNLKGTLGEPVSQ